MIRFLLLNVFACMVIVAACASLTAQEEEKHSPEEARKLVSEFLREKTESERRQEPATLADANVDGVDCPPINQKLGVFDG